MKKLDKTHVEKYINILRNFMNHKISVKEFTEQFLNTRRNDQYLFDGHYDLKIENVLSTLMLDVDHYCEPALADYDKSNPNHDITAEELYILAEQSLEKLNSI